METNSIASPVAALINQFALQTRLFSNVLDNVTEEQAQKQIHETNHLAWMAGHILSSRYMMANMFGVADTDPHSELFGNAKGLQKEKKYPSIAEQKKNWNAISEKLMEKLNALTEKELSAKAPFPLPMQSDDMKGFIAFIAHHEAYTIGQMGFLRRLHGLPGMKYN